MLDRTWMLGVLHAEREALGRTVQYTPPESWGAESPVQGWSIREILAHLAASEVAAAAILGGEEAAEVEEYRKGLGPGEGFDPMGFHGWAVERRAEAPVIELATEWGRAADLLLARASKLSEESWTSEVLPWVGGDLKAGYLVQARIAQWWTHGEDIRLGGGVPPRWEHWPVYCVNDLVVRLIPYSLARAELSFPGASVGVELEAVGGGSWHQPVERSAEPPEGKNPDAWITGNAPAFARVASGRSDVDVALYDGILNLGGDVTLAEAILRNLRATV